MFLFSSWPVPAFPQPKSLPVCEPVDCAVQVIRISILSEAREFRFFSSIKRIVRRSYVRYKLLRSPALGQNSQIVDRTRRRNVNKRAMCFCINKSAILIVNTHLVRHTYTRSSFINFGYPLDLIASTKPALYCQQAACCPALLREHRFSCLCVHHSAIKLTNANYSSTNYLKNNVFGQFDIKVSSSSEFPWRPLQHALNGRTLTVLLKFY